MGRKQRGRDRQIRRTKSTRRRPNNAKKEKKIKNINLDDSNSYLIKLEEKEGDSTIEVECGSNKADLYISKLCQGSKGQCIYFRDSWLTPNEYQLISGRESAKDWKRSIKHDGKSLKMLYEKGIFKIHKASCGCNGGRTLTSCFKRTEENDSLLPKLSSENTETSENEEEKDIDNKTEDKHSDIETADADDDSDTEIENSEDTQSGSQKDGPDSNDEDTCSVKMTDKQDEEEKMDTASEDENDLNLPGETGEKNNPTSTSENKQHSESIIKETSPNNIEQIETAMQNCVKIESKCVDNLETDTPSCGADKLSNVSLPDSKLPGNEAKHSSETVGEENETGSECVSETEPPIKTSDSVEVVKTGMPNSTENAIDKFVCVEETKCSVELCTKIDEPAIKSGDEDIVGPNDDEVSRCSEDVKTDVKLPSEDNSQTIDSGKDKEPSSTILDKVVQSQKRKGDDNESLASAYVTSMHRNNCYLKSKYSQSPPRESKLSSIINQLRSAKEKELTETSSTTPDNSEKESTELGTPNNRITKENEGKKDQHSAVPISHSAMRKPTPPAACIPDKESSSKIPGQQSELSRRQDTQSEKTTKFFNNKCNDSGRRSPVTGKTAEDISEYKNPGSNLSYDDYMKALAGMKPHLPFPPVSVEQFALQKNRNVPPSAKKPESAQIPIHNILKDKPPSIPQQEAVFPPTIYPHLLGAHLAFPWQQMPFLGLNPFLPLQHELMDSLSKKQMSSRQPEVDKRREKPVKRHHPCDEAALDLSNKKPKLQNTLDSKSTKDRLNSRTSHCGENNSLNQCLKGRRYSHTGNAKDLSVKYVRSVNDGRATDSVSSWINHSSVNKSTACTCKYDSKSDMINWDVDDVCQFVKNIPGCAQYVKKFQDHKVNGQCLPLLTTEQLTKCLKMTIGPALILTHSVARKISETRNLIKCEHCRPRDGLTVKTAI